MAESQVAQRESTDKIGTVFK